MKKTLCVILAALMLIGCLSVASVGAATDTAQIKLNGETNIYAVGSEVEYTCYLKTPATVENGQFTINYPSDILSVKSITFPVATDAMYNYKENLVDQIKFNFSEVMNGYDFSQDGAVLVNVKFDVVKAGTGTISLAKEVMCNINDIDIIGTSTFAETLSDSTACEHKTITTKKAKKATYFAKGYTGDKVCADCGEVIEAGKSIPVKKLKTPKVTVKGAKKAIKVTYKKVTDATGFKVTYKIGKKTSNKTFNLTKKELKKAKVTKTIKVKKAGKYKVTVKALIKSGKKVAYSNATKAVKVKVK
ncbi:MAG: cohesin domain-containing protein [Ruminococcus sp.]